MALKFCILAALLCVTLVAADQQEISLNGDWWWVTDREGGTLVPATVPGQVHTALYNGHAIFGDPYYGWNDWLLQWVGYASWTYFRTFTLTEEDFKGKSVWLKCDGLDTVANISVNNYQVGQSSNMHRRYLFDINLSSFVKAGENVIEVMFESASNYSAKMEAAYPIKIDPPGNYFNYSKRNFVRKTQSDFGWDWGPAFVPAGIWQNISIVTFEKAYVSYVVPKTFWDSEKQSYNMNVTVCVEIPHTFPESPAVFVEVDVTTPHLNDLEGSFEAKYEGETCGTISSYYINPDVIENYLWWPITVGKTPALLEVTTSVKISVQQTTVSTEVVKKKVGFRRIELVQDAVEDGNLFYFMMNTTHHGEFPIFAKGSNFIPMDAFVNRVTPEDARRLLMSAIDANQNMIRVWGGGLYQPDWFYDLCDELGLMVWQEFMFAVALYPRDEQFLGSVRDETRHQIRRLAHHPSIVLWSGNNENQAMAEGDPVHLVDYSALYDETIRTTLWEEDYTRPYWPSSPSNGALVDDRERELYIQRWGNSQNTSYGDVHRYDYQSYCTDVTKFPRPRFASEFGFQAYPSFDSLTDISGSEDWDNNSPLMEHRQHHPKGNMEMQNMMGMFFHLPNSTNTTLRFMDFIYLSQVVQAICIGAEAEHYRRLISEEGAYTRGTLYWQLNDIWQAQTWSSVEYGGRWKLLHYFIKRIYKPVLVSPFQLEDNINIYVVVDQPRMSISYSLQVEVINWKGAVVKTFNQTGLKSDGFTGVKVWSNPVATVFQGMSPKDGFLYIKIVDSTGGQVLADNHFFPANFTDVALQPPKITVGDYNQTEDKKTINFTLFSTEVAPFVTLFGPIRGVFSDNGFLMMPDRIYHMSFTSWEPIDFDLFAWRLRIRTVYDTYND